MARQVDILNAVLGRPSQLHVTGKTAVGHFYLDTSNTGYRLEETVSDLGAARSLTAKMSLGDMRLYIHGIMMGITLRNAQLLGEES